MRRVLSLTAVAAAAAALVLGFAPSASAAPDLSGKWNAASLRQGGPGYSMKVIAQDIPPASAYDAVLRFHFQDGHLGPKIKAGMLNNGSKIWMVLNGKGGLENTSNPNIMKGTVGNDGSLYFPTCYKQLTYVTKKMAPEMCLFQEAPA